MENTVPTLKNEKELVVSLVEDDNNDDISSSNVSISRQDTDVFDNEEEQPVRVEERSVHVEEQQTEEQKDNVTNDNTTESEDNAQSAHQQTETRELVSANDADAEGAAAAVEATKEAVRKADAIIYLPKDDEIIVSDYFTHLNEVEMSYTDHFCFSLKLGACMLVGFFAAVIHAIYPDVLTTSTTDTIHYIQKELKRRNDIQELQKRIRSQLHKIKRQ